MKETFYERIGEAVCRERLTNGLEVCVVPKPGYAKMYAFFSTRYGGMDTRFCLDGQWLNTPAGIAHYLEHKMFDTREGNALQELAKNGAEPNAFTANAMTAYYFDSTEHFEENLRILLSFVSNTVSFVRIGAFALNHVGMMMVVFALMDSVGTIGSPIVFVIGNVFVMCLEGLIVGIQVLRLEFYELFGRFYSGTGVPYQPFTVSFET